MYKVQIMVYGEQSFKDYSGIEHAEYDEALSDPEVYAAALIIDTDGGLLIK